MDLTQFTNYSEQTSKANDTCESAEHDWMVDNITDMATTLQSFVQTYYGATYARAGTALVPYIALMYIGLQNSTLYQEQIVAAGLQPAVESYWPLLNEGGRCSD
jgi:hypothetical protein